LYGKQAACSSADASGLAPNAVVADAVQDSRQTVRKTDVDEDEESDEKESRHDLLVLVCFIVGFVTFTFEDYDRSDGKEFADCKWSEIGDGKIALESCEVTEKRRQSDN